MFDFLIWSKIVRDSSLSNWPFFTRIYKAQRRVWASHGRLVPSSGLYRKSDTRMMTYTLSSRIQKKVNNNFCLGEGHTDVFCCVFKTGNDVNDPARLETSFCFLTWNSIYENNFFIELIKICFPISHKKCMKQLLKKELTKDWLRKRRLSMTSFFVCSNSRVGNIVDRKKIKIFNNTWTQVSLKTFIKLILFFKTTRLI